MPLTRRIRRRRTSRVATARLRRGRRVKGALTLLEREGSIGVPPVSGSIVRKYTWGLDLADLNGNGGPASSRSLEGVGGISGLLAMQQPPQIRSDLNCVYLYDANGNVGQLADWSHNPNDPAGALVATYEYDPYGGGTAQAGYYAAANPLRFSTKYWDDETGLGYWGYRYYSPALGRWISRDPIEASSAEFVGEFRLG